MRKITKFSDKESLDKLKTNEPGKTLFPSPEPNIEKEKERLGITRYEVIERALAQHKAKHPEDAAMTTAEYIDCLKSRKKE